MGGEDDDRGVKLAKTVFVTVGTTSFDALVKAVDTQQVKEELARKGYTHLLIQMGRGMFIPTKSAGECGSFSVDYFTFSSSIADHIKSASLVISHAGLRKIRDVNTALLGKWTWRFMVEDSAIWRSVIAQKYGTSLTQARTDPATGTLGCALWMKIQSYSDEVWKHISATVNNGETVRFWEDVWSLGSTLQQDYPHLYASSTLHNKKVKDVVVFDESAGQYSWNSHITRRLTDVQIHEFAELITRLGQPVLSQCQDHFTWKLNENGRFTCRSMITYLQEQRRASPNVELRLIPVDRVWLKTCLKRINFFVYCIFCGRLMTLDRRQRMFGSAHGDCVMCSSQVLETTDHLFVECPTAVVVWDHFWGPFDPGPCNTTSAVALQTSRSCEGLSPYGKLI